VKKRFGTCQTEANENKITNTVGGKSENDFVLYNVQTITPWPNAAPPINIIAGIDDE
jgi:hypothetical protein